MMMRLLGTGLPPLPSISVPPSITTTEEGCPCARPSSGNERQLSRTTSRETVLIELNMARFLGADGKRGRRLRMKPPSPGTRTGISEPIGSVGGLFEYP